MYREYFKPLFAPFIKFSLLILAFWTTSRLLLMAWQSQRVDATDGFVFIFFQGIRFDLVCLGYFLIIPALIAAVVSLNKRAALIFKKCLAVYFSVLASWAMLMECSTPSFIKEYDIRPNFIFVEYLKYTEEVFRTLWGAHRWQLILVTLLVPITAVLVYRLFTRVPMEVNRPNLTRALLAAFLSALTCFIMIRSTISHRPVNPSTVSFSPDPLVNELALNSCYTLTYAVAQTRHDVKGEIAYGQMPRDETIEIVRSEMKIPMDQFVSDDQPSLHLQKPSFQTGFKNLVIILEESLGAEFVGSLGGLDVTPNLDRLAGEGIWFENLYATGTRSVRGIEAVVSGFPPTPARSVVKRNKSQKDFFTIAGYLRQRGFATSFIYGGESHFDNMSRFFMGNGFEEVIDENDYDTPVFVGSWGVSDEDLFEMAHQKFEKMNDRPFFSLVFTSSNHMPFEFPDGRITLFDKEKQTVNNAVKYADYALGDFFEKARAASYYDETLFLVVADHNSRVYGTSAFPVERFRVPGLILGKGIEPRIYREVCSQLDLLPTLLSLMGIEGTHPAIGRDLFAPLLQDVPGRAIMQFHALQAYMEKDRLVLLEKDKDPRLYFYNPEKTLVEIKTPDPLLIRKAIAHSLWAEDAYQNNWYHDRISPEPVR